MRVAVFGVIALAACAGCATGTRSVANGSNGVASPMTYAEQKDVQNCDAGWFDVVARVCDSVGD
jgi:hypothetical protein